MHPHSALVLNGLSGQAGDFRAQQLTEAMPDAADLILAMTRSHRQDVLAAAPRRLVRTFTLLEAAALLGLLTDDAEFVGSTFPDRTRSLVAALAAARARRWVSGDDDVPDPIGHPVEVHEEVGEAIASALLALLRRIADMR
jgi:protein-tyrosine-phosphatase